MLKRDVQPVQFLPVRILITWRTGMGGGDGCLDLKGAGRSLAQGCFQQDVAFRDFLPVPGASVLLPPGSRLLR